MGDKYVMDPAKDPLFRGEFPVVMDLVSKLAGGQAAKNECDKVIDKNGTPKTGGNGIKQLRENIAESKLSYEIMDDAAQAFLKVKIMDNIHKYYYSIAFTAYMREMAEAARGGDGEKLPGGKSAIPGNQLKLAKTSVTFMDAQPELRGLIDTGKGNHGKIIHDIYQTAHQMFSDMPQGDHKKRAKYRFASKTLMRILPSSVKGEIEGLIEKKTISLDLYEILGKCTWKPV